MKKTRYALCGLSIRAINHFLLPLLGKATSPGANDFSKRSEVVGILDIDRERVGAFNESLGLNIPFFDASGGVDNFIEKCAPDVLLVAGPDDTHEEHIIAGLKHGLRVISEKPVVISSAQMKNILEAESKSRGSLIVAHNARYNTQLALVRELIARGDIGRVTNIEYVYNLDTFHGSSYFFRWNRERAKSGGLSIHKGVHHFDVLSWLIGSPPETVFAFGALNYFGPAGAWNPNSGSAEDLPLSEVRRRCPYFEKNYAQRHSPDAGRPGTGWDEFKLPYAVQYPTDAYIYDSAVDIEDTYSAVLQYRNGASVSYSCNFSTPQEGYSLAINGTKARIEASRMIHPDPMHSGPPEKKPEVVRVIPLFGAPQVIEVPRFEGGHGGSDPIIQRDLFDKIGERSRELNLPADSYAGALAVACGEGIWRSIKEKRSFTIRELLGEWYRESEGNIQHQPQGVL